MGVRELRANACRKVQAMSDFADDEEGVLQAGRA